MLAALVVTYVYADGTVLVGYLLRFSAGTWHHLVWSCPARADCDSICKLAPVCYSVRPCRT